jgi:hypothetical protein
MASRLQRLTRDPARIASLVLVLAGLVLLIGAYLGTSGSDFLVSDLAYIGTGGLGGLACLVVAGAVQVAANSARRCADLDRIDADLSAR